MVPIRHGKVVFIIAMLAVQIGFAAVLEVSKPEDGRGAYTTVMDAVRAAKAGDIIRILDEGVYEEQVTIDSTKNGLVLTSESSGSRRKPTIKWQDKLSVNPKTGAEAKDPVASAAFEKAGTYFDQNGAVRVFKARGVTIENIAIDGGGAYAFNWTAVWGQYPLFHGNSALCLWIAGDVTVRNCDLQNAYFGINVKDRNIRGVFAHPNPSDISRDNIIPLSGFGKTGNHLFEQNRMHNNSWGMFFESAWDMASTIRYNLFYNNYHQTAAWSSYIKGLGSEGQNQPGGALFFKDVPLSPVVIYNNTFWHNTTNIAGGWQIGASHLVFNNIFSEPNMYWKLNADFGNQAQNLALDIALHKRLKHNLYAVMMEYQSANVYVGIQKSDPVTNQNVSSIPQNLAVQIPIISNDLRSLQKGGYTTLQMPYSTGTIDTVVYVNSDQFIVPGAILLGTQKRELPNNSENRWLEVKFKSTDTSSADFLVPDWSDSTVNALIVDKGWPEAGIRDADGSIADLGAIPMNTTVSKEKISIKPVQPVIITGTTATASFNLYDITEHLTNPVIKYAQWVGDMPRDSVGWGSNVNTGTVLNFNKPATLTPVNLSASTIHTGLNTVAFNVSQQGEYAFLEIVVEGNGAGGQKVTSNVGILPYRKLQNIFSVKLYPATGPISAATELHDLKVGIPARLVIIPLAANGNSLTEGQVGETSISLTSPFPLTDPDGKEIKLTSIPLTGTTVNVMFTKIPNQGWDVISVTGTYWPKAGEAGRAIMGSSSQININPGPPAKILFQNPSSGGKAVVDPGVLRNVEIQVFDQYDNKVKEVTDVKLESLRPTIGGVELPNQVKSDSTGLAILRVKVTNGDLNDTFPIVGTLVVNGAIDRATMVVGKARNRMFIYYSDTASYNPNDTIPASTCTGVRVPVRIRASTDGYDTVTTINNAFSIEFSSSQLVAYKSETDTVPIKFSTLVNGFATIWIQLKSGSISDGLIVVNNETPEVRLYNGTRQGINFTACVNNIKSAEYRAENGFGRVDRLDLFYPETLKVSDLPDSLHLFWPANNENKRVVVTSSMAIDPTDKKHVVVTLPDPFPEEITTNNGAQLGISYWKNPLLTDNQVIPFQIKEKVGPLIKKATIIERLQQGASDILIVEFTEIVNSAYLKGNSLQLTKSGGITLRVDSVMQVSNTEFKLVIANQGETQSPQNGDLLKIYVGADKKSLIVDMNSNYAHPDNRPVTIGMQEIAPEVKSAFYEDRNGDGTIDFVTINYSKKVTIADQKYRLIFRSTINSDTIRSDQAAYGTDNTQVVLNLSTKGLPASAKGFTDGSMEVQTYNSKFLSVGPVIGPASDKAAPVIKTAEYIQGRVQDENTVLPDTVKVTFSEAIKSGPSISGHPFQFLQTASNTSYLVTLNEKVNTGTQYVFIVTPASKEMLTPEVKSASTGDSVRILVSITDSSSKFTDNAGNNQKLITNRRVRFEVVEQPVNLIVKLGPNPFVPDGSNSVSIGISPLLSTRKQNIKMQAKITILDNMGNLVYAPKEIPYEGQEGLKIQWNGINTKGRLVGTGTYIVYVKTVDLVKDLNKTEVFKLAIKRSEARK